MLESSRYYNNSQKRQKNVKENYRPASILPFLSKIFEKNLFKQISDYFEGIFDKHHCGFRKGYNTQQCLLKLLEKWKSSVDKGRDFDVLLTNLPKAFEFLDHELPIAKLDAYGFSLLAAILIHDYLSNRKQRTRTGNSYGS